MKSIRETLEEAREYLTEELLLVNKAIAGLASPTPPKRGGARRRGELLAGALPTLLYNLLEERRLAGKGGFTAPQAARKLGRAASLAEIRKVSSAAWSLKGRGYLSAEKNGGGVLTYTVTPAG